MKFIHNDPRLKERRRVLRNASTHEEIILWNFLKKGQMGKPFRRQFSIGPYIVDFYCPAVKLIIELDGEYHENRKEYDREREYFLLGKEYKILRFSNEVIHVNLQGVLKTIELKIRTHVL